MPRRNSHRHNEGVRRGNHERLDGDKLMARLGRKRTPAVGQAMQEARRRASSDA